MFRRFPSGLGGAQVPGSENLCHNISCGVSGARERDKKRDRDEKKRQTDGQRAIKMKMKKKIAE